MSTTTPHHSTYADSVTALSSALSNLTSAVSTLDAGTSDHPRLATILRSIRHYELIPATQLARAEASLRDEIGPAVEALLDRADAQLQRQGRRIETMKARAELQAGRLSRGVGEEGGRSKMGKMAAARGMGNGKGAAGKKLDGEAQLRAKMVRSRREALRYGVERMELELEQKERELRARLGAGD